MSKKNKKGAPTVMTEDVLQKLELAFAIDCSDEEACAYADIAESTLYNYQKENPYFLERKHRLKHRPVLKARQTVVKSLDDPNHAFKYLEKKRKMEFGSAIDITTDGKSLIDSETLKKSKEAIREVLNDKD